jgi:hypothetical protein
VPHILLTGAGFSRNWGGFLSTEAFEFLLGCPELNPRIRNRMWANSGNFEETYQQLKDEAAADPTNIAAADDFQRFNDMLIRMLDTMKIGFRSAHIERAQNRGVLAVDAFLDHFDAIFTLNQDTYLEQHYLYNPPQVPTHRWSARYLPGLVAPDPPTEHGNQLSKAGLRTIAASGFTLEPDKQPHIKLHGSYNWRSHDQHVMVIGGAKLIDINRVPLLAWYQEQFRSMITAPDVRLMIIGYSFNDDHINNQLLEAARVGTLFFIVDKLGLDVIDKRDPRTRATRAPSALFTGLRDRIAGASRRPIRPTFQSDPVEVKKYVEFLGIHIQYRYDT